MCQKPSSVKATFALVFVAAGLISACGLPSYAGTGTITIVKDAIPDTLVYFKYTGDLGTFYLDDDGVGANYKTFFCLLPRQYEITEVLPSGWELSHITIEDPDGGSSLDNTTAFIDLDADETVVVTFTNTRPASLGTIAIAKEADPEGSQRFDFVGDLGDFQLTDDGVSDNSFTFTDLIPGTYSVTETVPPGWNLTSAVCSDGSDPSAIDLNPGEMVTVTFTNTKQRGRIIVDKVTTPAGDSKLFTFSPSWGSSFQLADATTPYESDWLDAGTYSVTETVPSGWNLTSAVCSDGSDPSAIDLNPGETVTVTFTNTKVFDFGDAPQPYPTLLADNGARHEIPLTGRIWMGGQVDSEPDGQPTDLDGADEDGVVFLGSGPMHGPFTMPFVPGQYGAVRITISGGTGYLHGWFDWNEDGDWSDPGENVFSMGPLAPQTYEIGFPVPTSAITGTTWARFRLDDQNLNSFVGLAHNGEVEDYPVKIGVSPVPPPNLPEPSEPPGTAAPTLTAWGTIILPFLMFILLAGILFHRGKANLGKKRT